MSEDKLHKSALELMESLDEKYGRTEMMSLDEYHIEYREEHTKEENEKIINLINRF